MKFAVLGTGIVGRTHAARLKELKHDVVIGAHDVEKALVAKEPDQMGTPPFSLWHEEHSDIKVVTFEEAVKHGEIIVEALKGEVVVEALKKLEADINGKILIDISNPLDFSKGMPPSLFISNTDSLGEKIQRELPQVKVVKTFNTTNAFLQVDPMKLKGADHSIFVSGNDKDAKAKVEELLKSYGWRDIIDLGDITTARGTEMLFPIWLRLWGALQNPMFNFKVVR